MVIEKALDRILNTPSKLKIIRLFISKRQDFVATGREIARKTGLSPPGAHTALKELYAEDILKRDIIGKQHLYRLNINNRNVKNILIPAFTKEISVKKDIANFLKGKIKEYKLTNEIVSLLLYGSICKGTDTPSSDVDVAVVTGDDVNLEKIETAFIDKISSEFHEYFGLHLDPYIKKKKKFVKSLNKKMPPVSTLIKTYTLVYGKDLTDIK